jgi:hypothetical protein
MDDRLQVALLVLAAAIALTAVGLVVVMYLWINAPSG